MCEFSRIFLLKQMSEFRNVRSLFLSKFSSFSLVIYHTISVCLIAECQGKRSGATNETGFPIWCTMSSVFHASDSI